VCGRHARAPHVVVLKVVFKLVRIVVAVTVVLAILRHLEIPTNKN
jgi:hypothetical protein